MGNHTLPINEIMKLAKKDQLNAIYEMFDEDSRLNRSQAARVEFLTTMKYIDKYLKQGMRILDIGAGAGEYSIALAQRGFQVDAIEFAKPNLEKFQSKISGLSIDLIEGDARDLSYYADQSFDMVLLMGPLYHLHEAADRDLAVQEAKRVLRDNGILLVAFIANDMIPLTELTYRPSFFSEDSYDHETFQVFNEPFVFMTLSEMRRTVDASSLTCLHEVAVDGMSELLADTINRMSHLDYEQYLKYHFYCCEKPEHLGRTNHTLFVMQK